MTKFIPLIFIPAFIILWCFVVWLLLSISGLYQLQKRFPLDKNSPREKKTLPIRSGIIRGINFKGILSLYTTETGLIIKLLPFFNIGFKGSEVPWSEIQLIDSGKVFFSVSTTLDVAGYNFRLFGNNEFLLEKM